MAIHAAQNYGCRVTTTTISKEQYDFARAAVKKAGLEDRIDVLFSDYRDLEGRFDKLVSVEMIEAVGHRFYPQFFKGCSQLLKPDGLMLLQSITIADQRYHQYQKSADFIQLYIFPGGELPSVQVIADQFATHSDMQIVGLEDITPHYAQTLADWRKNFRANISRVRELGFDSVFERMWEYYLCYCEGGFRERMISTVQILAAKPECRQLPLIKQ
jgi:cyclopropane-fatty-acyl-phospholipid synthase